MTIGFYNTIMHEVKYLLLSFDIDVKFALPTMSTYILNPKTIMWMTWTRCMMDTLAAQQR